MKPEELIPLFFSFFYAKPVQLYGRLIFLLKRRFIRVAASKSLSKRAQELLPQFPPLSELRCTILNKEEYYTFKDLTWEDRRHEKLWRYTLNYFYWLHERPFKEGAVCVLHWIAYNDDESREPWEPAVISHRVSQWIEWTEKHKEEIDAVPGFRKLLADSLLAQLSRLSMDLEFHVQANHLLMNYKALITGSLYLSGYSKEKTDRLLVTAINGFLSQLEEQILPDGGHYERSPLYHCLVLQAVKEVNECAVQAVEDIKAGALLTGKAVTGQGGERRFPQAVGETLAVLLERLCERCASLLSKMEEWQSLMTHPDGAIALFGDSAFNVYPFIEKALPTGGSGSDLHLTDSGYVIQRWGDDNYFVIKLCGPSPAWQPGHSHCDILSFELSLHGERVIVDSGCGSYQNPEIRQYCRGTGAHNVAWIEGSEQSELGGAFRFGRRAVVRDSIVTFEGDSITVAALIEDYRGNRIRRKVTLTKEKLSVEDRLIRRRTEGNFLSLIHIGPSVEVKEKDNTSLHLSGKNVRFSLITSSPLDVSPSRYYPELGLERENHCIAISGGDNSTIEYEIVFQETR